MKTFSLITIIAAGLIMAASCGNSDTRASEPVKMKHTAATVKTDTAKFTLSMVYNKKDLVCRMPLTAGIGDTVHYKGKVYGFCSKGCKASFVEDPESYLKEK